MARPDESQLGLFDAPIPVTGEAEPPAAPVERAARSGPAASADDERPLPDETARERIRTDLESNLLVEAGAGSGKTRALVERMTALVRTGTADVEAIAAVTFTRKAAAELRERFQGSLEAALAENGDPEEAARLDRALRNVDRAFVGTIHSFCARLLRERPIEAGLDPGFQELLGAEEMRLRDRFWRSHLERVAAEGDPLAESLVEVGLTPSRLRDLFDEVVGNPDVVFPVEPRDPPSDEQIDDVREQLLRLLSRGLEMIPAVEPEKGWDDLQKRLRSLRFLRSVVDWSDRTAFLDLLSEEVHAPSGKVTQYKWGTGEAKTRAKELGQDWQAFREGPVQRVMEQWWEHRYPRVIRFVERAAKEFEEERRRTGQLNFGDLLMRAAALLREHPGARSELGERYRRLLVDEFQDTDPVQAEVLFLLTSPPDDRRWQEAVPRPGALFVVGDPKQSIYRFRRADIAVYNLVRERFRELGDVVELVSNFRSHEPIGDLVDAVFGGEDGRFPPEPTPFQAAFAPLRTRRDDIGGQGVYLYDIEPESYSNRAVAEAGAERLAPWIRERIDAGERTPEDFLVLSRRRVALAPIARALEAWGIPVRVTGAGIDAEEELRELVVLLDALTDPSNPVKVLAVLTGPFFGLDHEQLVAWALKEDLPAARRDETYRSLSLTSFTGPGTGGPVDAALARLRRWWDRSRTEPADLVVARIVEELALLPLSAARELGALRAGALLYAVDAVRAAALQGDTSLHAALEALLIALDSEEAEAPLEPASGRGVRLMTLHQAKGLEAPVVVLAYPRGGSGREPSSHVERTPDGSATGYLVVQERDGHKVRIHARPPGWSDKADRERLYDEAEQDRLLYVAATRAEEALVVERVPGKESGSPWAGLYDWIDRNGRTLVLRPTPAPIPTPMPADPRPILDRVEAVRSDRATRARPGYVASTVTVVAKRAEAGGVEGEVGEGEWERERERGKAEAEAKAWAGAGGGLKGGRDPEDGPDPEFRGLSWGSVVHGALDAAARGAIGDRLRAVCRALLLQEERPVVGDEPAELDELVGLVEQVVSSDLWARARSSDRVLTEAPFAARMGPDAVPDPADQPAPVDGAPRVLEGVIDLAFREPDGWVIADYKTDVGTDPGFPARRAAYRRQVELYARAWEALTGEPVKERVLLFTARSAGAAVEAW